MVDRSRKRCKQCLGRLWRSSCIPRALLSTQAVICTDLWCRYEIHGFKNPELNGIYAINENPDVSHKDVKHQSKAAGLAGTQQDSSILT